MPPLAEHYRLLLAIQPDAVLVAECDTGRILIANEGARRLYGLSDDDWTGRTLGSLATPPPGEWSGPHALSMPAGGPEAEPRPRATLQWHRRRDGTPFPVEISCGRDRIDGHELAVYIVRDVTERENAARALRESERRFRAIADYTYDWESWHGVDGRLLWVNPAVERLTGYSPQDCHAMPDYPLPIVAAEDRPAIQKLLEAVRTGSHGNDVPFRIRRRDGDLRWMAISWQPIYDPDGAHIGLRTSVRDISERRRLEDQIRQHAANLEIVLEQRTRQIRELEHRRTQIEKLAALGRLAAGVAHEVNNPLAGIRNAFELLKRGLPREHEYYELIELIDGEIGRIADLVHQLYQLYRPHPRPAQPLDVAQSVNQVLRLLQHAARRRSISLELKADAALPQFSLPEGDLKQVLYNLLLNAIQASPDGAKVSVEIAVQQSELRIAVVDHGTGIEPDILPRIFDPFFTTRHGSSQGGMGMGLSVSRSVVEAMGGRIDIASRPGRGSTFTIVLPGSPEATAAPDQ